VLTLSLTLLFGVGVVAPASTSDLYFEQTVVSTLNGRAGRSPGTARVWRSEGKLRIEQGKIDGGHVLILRLDLGVAYGLDPSRKIVHPIDLEWLRARSQMDLAAAADMLGGSDAEARLAPLEGSKTIAGYECNGFRIRAGPAVIDLYLTEALPVGIDAFSELLEWSGAPQALYGVLSRVQELRGFPLQTRSRVRLEGDVVETVATVSRVELLPIAPSLFEPPAGYTQAPIEAEAPGQPQPSRTP
jgi:hypothetical protein